MKRTLLTLMLVAGVVRPLVAVEPSAQHWAFQPIRHPSPPDVRGSDWCRNDVDRFLLAAWERQGLQPAQEADRRTLIRRAAFDLTGLPPTAPETDAYLTDSTSNAWDRVVERLLASPHYGEHWGRHWLDVVRYADTAGETADYPVPVAWRYRDYVIRAFNADKPYDVFLREQIAGDILAREGPRESYAERVTATGYLAISRRFGFDSENYHHLTIQDSIDNLGQTVLGLTLGCARCHAHKYDPISMQDYYGLYGIFDSTRYAFPGSEQKQRHRSMVPLLPPDEAQPRWRAFEAKVASCVRKLEGAKQIPPNAVLRSLDDLDGDFEMQAPAAGGSKGVLVAPWLYQGPIAVTQDAQSPFKNLYALGKVGASIPSGPHVYSLGQTLYPRRSQANGGVLHLNLDFRLASNAPSGAFHRLRLGTSTDSICEVLLGTGQAHLRTGTRQTAIRTLAPGLWYNLQLAVEWGQGQVSGRLGRPGDMVEFNGIPTDSKAPEFVDFVALNSLLSGQDPLAGIVFDNLGVQDTPIPPVSTEPASGTDQPDVGGVAEIRKELERLLASGPFEMAYAVSEGTPRDAALQIRGEPDRPGEIVPRGLLSVLGGQPLPKTTTGSGRLELAKALTDPKNPLTARVMVNRIWQYHFGQGLVRTPNDFGTRGQAPSDPDLLDFLATRFIESGWSIKAMHRLILSSASYRQQSRFTPFSEGSWTARGVNECPIVPSVGTASSAVAAATAASSSLEAAIHPFSPFPRRRLGAEEIRDAILRVGGGLDESPANGHPFPPPTTWGYTQHGPYAGVYDHERRSVYLMTQRLKRHPFLALFDGADPNSSSPERRTSTVPTQALYFLNDPFVHAQAEKFAESLLASETQPDVVVAAAYRRALGRNPSPTELKEGSDFLRVYAEELETVGSPHVARLATAALARVLFGSNEFLTVD